MGFFSKNKNVPPVKVVRTNAHYIRAKSLQKRSAVERTASGLNKINAVRSFDGGRKTRLTEDWNYGLHNNLNLDLKAYKKVLDERAEDLIKNNPYIAGFLLRETANVIGDKGFILQVKSAFPDGTLDEFANTFIEKNFRKWTRKEYCTMHGRFSFVRVQWMILNSLLSSGEYLLRKVTGISPEDNPFSFSLEILDPREIDINYSAVFDDGTICLMGVRINSWRKILGVYLKPQNLKDETYFAQREAFYQADRKFIPANELYFDFDSITQYGIKQIRGFTPLSSAMLLVRSIDRWENATLTNATATAKKMGFLIRKNMQGQSFVGSTVINSAGKEVEGKDTDGGKYMEFEDGTVEELPLGYEFIGWDPKYPHEQHEMYVRSMLKKFATSRGVNYNSLFNDYGGVTFSSLRAGAVDERDIWMLKQTMIQESFLIPLYNDWLYWSLLSQALFPLQFQNRTRYEDHIWQPKRWKWVKPLEDVQAKQASVSNLFESPIDVAAELGNDFEDIKRDIRRVKEFADEIGISPQWLLKMIAQKPQDDNNMPSEEDMMQDEEDMDETTDGAMKKSDQLKIITSGK